MATHDPSFHQELSHVPCPRPPWACFPLLSTPHPIPSLREALGRLLEGETPGPEQTPEGRARMSGTHTAQDRAKILAHGNPGSTP